MGFVMPEGEGDLRRRGGAIRGVRGIGIEGCFMGKLVFLIKICRFFVFVLDGVESRMVISIRRSIYVGRKAPRHRVPSDARFWAK